MLMNGDKPRRTTIMLCCFQLAQDINLRVGPSVGSALSRLKTQPSRPNCSHSQRLTGGENKVITQLLLDADADISISTRTGETVLHWAAASRSCSTVFQLLIKAGADTSARNSCGETPLHWASDMGYTSGV